MPSRFRQGTARILHVHQCAALFCAMLALVHCSRHSVPPPVAQDPDSGVVAVPCDPAPKYSVSAGPPASVSPVQATGWSITSSGGSCAGLQPRAIGPMLQWSSPSTDYYVCDAPEIDGDGTVAIHTPVLEVAHEEGPAAVALLSTDGSSRSIINSNTVRSVQPRSSSGFWLLDNHCWGKETRNRVALDGGLQESTPSEDSRMFPNPQGGFVEARTAADFLSTEVRWLDDHLVATSPWHSVKTWPPGNRTEKLALDKLGRVLFLTFHFPSTFGAPPPPPTGPSRPNGLARKASSDRSSCLLYPCICRGVPRYGQQGGESWWPWRTEGSPPIIRRQRAFQPGNNPERDFRPVRAWTCNRRGGTQSSVRLIQNCRMRYRLGCPDMSPFDCPLTAGSIWLFRGTARTARERHRSSLLSATFAPPSR